jgi:hypothetical protein
MEIRSAASGKTVHSDWLCHVFWLVMELAVPAQRVTILRQDAARVRSIALDILLFTLLKCKTTSIEKPFDQQVGNLADPDHHRRFAPANSAGEQGL